MKQLVKCAVLMLVVTLAVGALAAEKSITLSSPATLNGQKLSAGDYRVQYTVNGSTADVKILKNKKEVASGTAQVKELDKSRSDGSVLLSENPDGSKQLIGMQFGKTEIRFSSEGASGGN